MQIPVLVEPLLGNGFQAVCGSPLSLSAHGATPEEALRNLQQLVKARLVPGSSLVPLEVPAVGHPWMPHAGDLAGHPLLAEWEEGMAEYRKSVENDSDVW